MSGYYDDDEYFYDSIEDIDELIHDDNAYALQRIYADFTALGFDDIADSVLKLLEETMQPADNDTESDMIYDFIYDGNGNLPPTEISNIMNIKIYDNDGEIIIENYARYMSEALKTLNMERDNLSPAYFSAVLEIIKKDVGALLPALAGDFKEQAERVFQMAVEIVDFDIG